MQPNTFTLSVNEDNDDGTTAEVDVVYTRFDEYQNRSEYISAAHEIAARDKLGFYRTFPKVSGNFRGTAKCAVKITQDMEVEGVDATTTLIVPAILDVGFSFPVGMTDAERLALRMRLVAALLDDALMVPLIDQQMV